MYELLNTAFTFAGVAAAAVAIFVSVRAHRVATRSADATVRAAAAAERSASEAANSTEIAYRRQHRERRPRITVEGKARTQGRTSLATLVNGDPVKYQYNGWRIAEDDSRTRIAPGEIVEQVEVQVGHSATGRARQLELWVDGPCGCPYPDGEVGHWRLELEVRYPGKMYGW